MLMSPVTNTVRHVKTSKHQLKGLSMRLPLQAIPGLALQVLSSSRMTYSYSCLQQLQASYGSEYLPYKIIAHSTMLQL